MKINVDVGGTSHVYSSANISENLGGKNSWELADIIKINTSKEWGFSVPDEDELVVKLINMDSREVIPKCRISLSPESAGNSPEHPIDYCVAGNSVVPNDNFISSFTVLGASINSSNYVQMVTTQFKIGNDTFNPWNYSLAVTGNVNDGKTHLWILPKTYTAGTPVTIIGQSWLHKNTSLNYSLDSSWTSQRVVNSTSNSPNLKVLKNGADVPKIPGSEAQPPVEEFIKDYAKNGKIVLGENEAIFLFELGVTNLSSSGADFQDLVVLLKVDSAPAS
ncbi:hypothetical protein MSLAZ_0152 [Methanosarcina lacustris Z-7289]|uniref:Uncharacterized protein n=2 Tax=Methanosarcina lacustris TaxID=170861 RepID=A0A0E3S3U1_9EURY|nr:hypothetical protein MSLAZ_0152 [Methanosarcina lacustris Z-7289]